MILKLTVFLCISHICNGQNGYSSDVPDNRLGYRPFGASAEGFGADGDELNGDEIPGEPGTDYPILAEIPHTRFSCDAQAFHGYYADQEADCQVFHICQDRGRQDSFLCPNGTVFNQQYLVCDWWFNFDCDRALDFYSINEQIALEQEHISGSTQGNGYGRGPTSGASFGQRTGGSSRGTFGGQPAGLRSSSGTVGGTDGRSGFGGGGYQNQGPSRSSGQQGFGPAAQSRPAYGPPRSGTPSGGSRASHAGPSRGNDFPRVTQAIFRGFGDSSPNSGSSNPDRSYLPPF